MLLDSFLHFEWVWLLQCFVNESFWLTYSFFQSGKVKLPPCLHESFSVRFWPFDSAIQYRNSMQKVQALFWSDRFHVTGGRPRAHSDPVIVKTSFSDVSIHRHQSRYCTTLSYTSLFHPLPHSHQDVQGIYVKGGFEGGLTLQADFLPYQSYLCM